MALQRKKWLFLLIGIILPLIAVCALGVSSYLWYRALKPELIPPPTVVARSQVNPDIFSAELKGNLAEVMSGFGIGEKSISRVDRDVSKDGVRHIYTVKVPEKVSLILVNLKITTMAKDMGGSVFHGIESSDGRILTLSLGARKTPTDVVILKKYPGIEAILAKMAVIIDDVGVRNTETAANFCELDQTITLSILPFRPYTSQAVELARATKTPYMLHMPMEPKSSRANPGEGVLLVKDDKSVIRRKLLKAFRSVQGAGGLNNHMGSKVTENVRTMEIVMEFLSQNNLFFIDSKTTLNTVGYYISNKTGVKSAIIDGFLDVDNSETAVENKLELLAKQALTNGRILVIGHDRPNTLAVLKRKLPELEKKGITFVGAHEMIR